MSIHQKVMGQNYSKTYLCNILDKKLCNILNDMPLIELGEISVSPATFSTKPNICINYSYR